MTENNVGVQRLTPLVIQHNSDTDTLIKELSWILLLKEKNTNLALILMGKQVVGG